MADRFAARLAVEAETWVRAGLVTAQQAAAIVARYPPSAAWFTRPVALFSLVGGGLSAAGVALVVAHNWADIHRWVKLGGLALLMLAAHAGGLALHARGRRHLGDGLLLLGGALLLVGIALVGQVYHLSGRASDPVLLWWALLLPAGYALPSSAVVALAYTGTAAWFLLALGDETTALGAAVRADGLAAVAVAAFAFALFVLGLVHGERVYRRVGRFLEALGLAGVTAGLLALGAHEHVHRAPRVDAAPGPVAALLLLASLALAAAAVWLPRAPRSGRVGFVLLLLAVLVLLALTAAVAVTPALAPLARGLRWAAWAVLFALGLGLILAGARWGRASWINLGLLSILVQAVWRYLELLGSLLDTGALFLSTGLVVLLLGWGLERLRRRLTTQARAAVGER